MSFIGAEMDMNGRGITKEDRTELRNIALRDMLDDSMYGENELYNTKEEAFSAGLIEFVLNIEWDDTDE